MKGPSFPLESRLQREAIWIVFEVPRLQTIILFESQNQCRLRRFDSPICPISTNET